MCRPAIGGPAEPTDPLLNPPRGQVTASDPDSLGMCVADGKWMYQGTCGSVSPLSSVLAGSPWGLPDGDGDRRREEEEVLHGSGTGRAADGRGSSTCSRQALANDGGPGSHGSSQFDPNRPKRGYSMQRAGPPAKPPSQLR